MMKSLIVASMLASAVGFIGCTNNDTTPAADIQVSTMSAESGNGQSVTFKGDVLELAGEKIGVGDPLPDAMLTSINLSSVNLGINTGKVRIISIVPSLDTPVCEAQTHFLSEKNDGLDQEVEMYTVSMDLPFAQNRFAKEAKINNITFLSDYKSAEFGKNYGLLIKPLHLLSRAVIVTDNNNIVRYIQVVPEITTLPDMKKAMSVARSLI